MMRIFKNSIGVLVISSFLIGCSPLKQLQTAQTEAEKAYSAGDYSNAYLQLTSVIDKYEANKMELPAGMMEKAGVSALKTSDYAGATEFLNQALGSNISLESIKSLVEAYIQQSQYAKAGETLAKYADFLKKEGQQSYLADKQFGNHVKIGDQDKIVSSYANLENPTEEQAMVYLKTLEGLGRNKEALQFCKDLVKENPSYHKAREWKALYYYDFAEGWYKSEMNKYNKDKNYTAYVYLKRELKKISANYRVAKSDFETLRKSDPENKKYIKYLKNVYLRLEMKKEAAAMDKLLK